MSSSECVVVPKAILEAVRDRFNEYADHHAAKPDPEKAKRNRDMADMVHEALAAASPSNSRLGGEPVAWAELRADIDAKLLSDSFDRAVVMYGPLSNAAKISELAERDALLRRLLASPTSGENGVREALSEVLASLVAAVSILERAHLQGKQPRFAVGSDAMFVQMLEDYTASIKRGRAALSASPAGGES